jgi:hypothetical protein
MAIIQRYSIDRFKEILINQPSGLVQDGFGGYTLDEPLTNPIGTGDFLGVIKTSVLLAEVYRDTLDTGNVSIAQFNNLSQQEFDDYVNRGIFKLFRANVTAQGPFGRFGGQRVGWVEIGRSRASFYYQNCDGGKRPISEHYYDINSFVFDNKILQGDGSQIEPTDALNQIGNFDPNIAANMGVIRPRFNPVSLVEYMRFATNPGGVIINDDGESAAINRFDTRDSNPFRVSLLMANRRDHFDSQFATEVSPGKWGMVRDTIQLALRPNIQVIDLPLGQSVPGINIPTVEIDFSRNEGQCLEIVGTTIGTGGGAVLTGGVTTTTPVISTVMPPTPSFVSDYDIYNPPVSIDFSSKRWDNIKIVGVSPEKKLERVGNPPPNTDDRMYTGATQLRILYQTRGHLDGWKDPREAVNDNLESPLGEIYGSFNSKTDEYVIKPAVLRQPIIQSIQEKVGAIRGSLADTYRRNCFRMYNCSSGSYKITTDKIGNYKYTKPKPIFHEGQILFLIGNDELGNSHFSDSDSFRERCIFTGYNKSFENRIDVSLPEIDNEKTTNIEKEFWSNITNAIKTETWDGKKTPYVSNTIKDKDGKTSYRRFAVTYISKSGRYFTSSPPVNTLFLGYYEEDAFYSTSTTLKKPRIGLTKDPNDAKTGYRLFAPNYSVKERRYKNDGTFRDIMINNVYKNDVILKNVSSINENSSFLKQNISIPKLAPRRELYGPNPFQHILYADYLVWERYLTNYNFNWIKAGGFDLNNECSNYFRQYGWRVVPITDRYEKPVFVSSEDYPNFYWIEIKDKTRILDVYFGLMEMHIKGYPWSVIFEVMDKLPDGYKQKRDELDELKSNCNNPIYFKKMKDQYQIITNKFEEIWNYMIQKKYVTPSKITPSSNETVITNIGMSV